ncbi:hypothetical protein HIM_09746 [Hirsutella minnesotensis 3608]|uniref:Crh-like protein n=1 Tax=Hirsutella minnesotensis 3608 TaxID=1043627 RepID=A0A0F7ZGH1_9HYPO|nr:hypothetical protein HIM_09746 [Hirsutella minnesotensis 3608]
MFPQHAKATFALALAASSLVSGQTSTSCHPRLQKCPADPALGTKLECDFRQGKCDGLHALAGTTVKYDADKGAIFSVDKPLQGPTLRTDKYIFFGKVEVELQCAPTQGLITSIVLESDALDEIDWEWIGSQNSKVQTNYFRNGDDGTYDRGDTHAVANPSSSFHKYGLEWTKEKMVWTIDGQVVRTRTFAEAKGKYPETPMRVRLGIWAVDEDQEEGRKIWAGGAAQFDKGPFLAHYRNLNVVDYAGGDKPANGGIKEYVYGDQTGTWQTIKVIKNDGTLNKQEINEQEIDVKSSASQVVETSSRTSTASVSSATAHTILSTKSNNETISSHTISSHTISSQATNTTIATTAKPSTSVSHGFNSTSRPTLTRTGSTTKPTATANSSAGRTIASIFSVALVSLVAATAQFL